MKKLCAGILSILLIFSLLPLAALGDETTTTTGSSSESSAPAADSKVTIERIPVEKGGRKVLIPVDDIRFIMAKDDYSCIYTVDDRFLSTTSLAQFEAKLCDFGFFRVHRRYIVNLACVTDVETVPSGAIQLGITGVDERVPVSRRRVVPLKKALSL